MFRCAINKDVEIEVKTHFRLPSYTYLIMCREMIVFANTKATEFTHRFTFLPNFDYAPESKVIVYCVRDGKIIVDSVKVNMYDDFNAFIDLDVKPNTVQPGQIVDINVKSNPNSYIGLLGIDKSVLFSRGSNYLANDEIWDELNKFCSQIKLRSIDYLKLEGKWSFHYNSWYDFAVSEESYFPFSN